MLHPNAQPRPKRLGKPDIPALVALEKLCFSVPWTAKQYEDVIRDGPFTIYGLEVSGVLAAYVTYFAADWEMEILNIAVQPALRRKGYGRLLLGHVLQLCRRMGIKRGYLEVRRSNEAAQGLYASFGFAEVGVRKRYYPDNMEDALVMRMELDQTADDGSSPVGEPA